MRVSERDLLLLILAVSAGSADGWSYFGIGHAFVANMTGNTVLLGWTYSGMVATFCIRESPLRATPPAWFLPRC